MNHEQRATTLRITLDQLVNAESVCVGCDHNEGIEPTHSLCCRKGGSCATKRKVNWNDACPIGKWSNKPAPEPSKRTADDNLLSLQVRYLKQKRVGITLGGPVLTRDEMKRAATSLRAST